MGKWHFEVGDINTNYVNSITNDVNSITTEPTATVAS